MYLWLITAICFQNWQIWALAENKSSVCSTPECIELGKMFKKNLNKDVNRCVDFYSYVCHGWANQNPRPKYISTWYTGQAMEEKAYANLKKLVEDKRVSNVREEQYAKALYAACMHMPHMEKSDPETIMLNLDEWPLLYPKNQEPQMNVPAWVIDKRYIELTGQSALFDIAIEADESELSKLTVVLDALSSPYGAVIRKRDWSNKREYTNYKSFLNNIVRKVAPRNSKLFDDVINDDIDQIIKFREELRRIRELTASEELDAFTIQKFQDWYDQFRKTEKYNWLQIFRAIRKTSEDPQGEKVTPKTTIFVVQQYFVFLDRLLQKTSKRVLVNHIIMYFVERHLQLDRSLIVQLKDSFTLGANITGMIRHDEERWHYCLQKSNMQFTLGKMYTKQFFPKEKKTAAKELLEKTKELLKEQISESNWLDPSTAANAFKKIDKMKAVIGYPDWENKDLINELRTLDERVNPARVHVIYVTEWNLISVTAAYLQPPVFYSNVPYVITYGITVFSLGHELYHAFDVGGVMHGANGEKILWPLPMRMKYSDKAACFLRHYEKFKIDEFKKQDACLDGKCPFTIDEDLADSMGLKLAYKGYRKKLNESKGACQVLPGFEDFSCEQLFFIAFANTHCAAPSTESQQSAMFNDVHSAYRTRVNAAVSNMREFGDAFNCKPGEPLRATNSCDMWKG